MAAKTPNKPAPFGDPDLSLRGCLPAVGFLLLAVVVGLFVTNFDLFKQVMDFFTK